MNRFILFFLLSLPVIVVSRKSLRNFRNHGFYRFFGWEGIVWMITGTYKSWIRDYFSFQQIISSLLLIISVILLLPAVNTFLHKGNAHSSRNDEHLFGFEKTTQLIDTGIYKYIRHPMYSSLIFLTWGICMKNPNLEILLTAFVSTLFFIITALYDEKECIAYFGEPYVKYMQRSKRFIPFMV